jgi:hypothetical protein
VFKYDNTGILYRNFDRRYFKPLVQKLGININFLYSPPEVFSFLGMLIIEFIEDVDLFEEFYSLDFI